MNAFAETLNKVEERLMSLGLKYNTINRVIEDESGGSFDTIARNALLTSLKKELGSTRYVASILNALPSENITPFYHPIETFFNTHIGQCTTGHIDRIAACIIPKDKKKSPLKTDQEFISHFIRKWLIGLVSTIYGAPSQLTLILVAHPFDIDFFQFLLPEELRRYYVEASLCGGKRIESDMCTKVLVCDSCYDTHKNDKMARYSSMATRKQFTYREGKAHRTRPRLATLCGISPDAELLRRAVQHPFGNWRIIGIDIDAIDYDAYYAIDKTALFMEAYHAWKSGETFQVNPDDIVRMRH